jgi:hypothetical protein
MMPYLRHSLDAKSVTNNDLNRVIWPVLNIIFVRW